MTKASGNVDEAAILLEAIRAATTNSGQTGSQKMTQQQQELERQLAEVDQKLNSFCKKNHNLLMNIRENSHTFIELMQKNTDTHAGILSSLDSAKRCVSSKAKEEQLKESWEKVVELRSVVSLLEKVAELKVILDEFDGLVAARRYLFAAQRLNQAHCLFKELETLGRNDDDERESASWSDAGRRFCERFSQELELKQKGLYHKLLSMLNREIYLRSTGSSVQLFHRASSRKRASRTRVGRNLFPSSADPLKGGSHLGEVARAGQTGGGMEGAAFDLSLKNLKLPEYPVKEIPGKDLDSDPVYFVAIILECFSMLIKLGEGMKEIKEQVETELQAVIRRATQMVLDNMYQDKNYTDEEIATEKLPELLNVIFTQFKCVLGMHKVVLELLCKIKASGHGSEITLYTLEDVWIVMLGQLEVLVRRYANLQLADGGSSTRVAIDIAASYDIAGHFLTRQKKRKEQQSPAKRKRFHPPGSLFAFSASLQAMYVTDHLRDKRQKDLEAGIVDALLDAGDLPLLCSPSIFHVVQLYKPIRDFMREISLASTDCLLDARNVLSSFLQQQVVPVYLGELRASRARSNAGISRSFEMMRVEEGEGGRLLVSVSAVGRYLDEMLKLSAALPEHSDDLARILLETLEEFSTAAAAALSLLVTDKTAEPRRKVAASDWVEDTDIRRIFTSQRSLWKSISSAPTSSEEQNEAIVQETKQFLSGLRQEAGAERPLVLEDHDYVRCLARLHESLAWLSDKLDDFLRDISSDSFSGLEKSLVAKFRRVQGVFRRISEDSLLILHLDSHIRCYNHLAEAEHHYSGMDLAEPTNFVERLSRDLGLFGDALSGALGPQKHRYVFDGLGHLVSSQLIGKARYIKLLSDSGIRLMCRNIYQLQQNLAKVSVARQADLDYAKMYYELLYQTPEDTLLQIDEEGGRYTEEEYRHLMDLWNRNHGGSVTDGSIKEVKQRLSSLLKAKQLLSEQV